MATRSRPQETLTPDEVFPPAAAAGAPSAAAGGLIARAPEFQEDDAPPESAADRVAALLTSMRGDDRAKVSLYRSIGPGELEWCAEYAVERFEAGGYAMIRNEWGPGSYEIRLYGVAPDRHGREKFGIRAREQFNIAHSTEAAPAQSRNSAGEITAALAPMIEAQREMLRALTERPAQPDPMAQMMQMMQMMTLMRQAIGDASPQKSSIGEIVEAIKELRGAKELIDPDSGDDNSNPMKMIPSVLEIIKAQMTQQQAAPQPVALPATFAAAPAPMPTGYPPVQAAPDAQAIPATAAPNPENTQSPENTEVNPIQAGMLQFYVDKLAKLAEKGGDVTEAATLIYEKMPDEVIDMMAGEDWYDLLVHFFPAFAPHKEWLTRARNAALAMFEPTEDDSPGAKS